MNDAWKQQSLMWAKWFAGIVGGFAALWLVVGWSADVYKHFEKAEHHNEDIQLLLGEIAERDQQQKAAILEQQRLDRIQRNYRELQRVQRDFIAERFVSEAEKEFMLNEIRRLERAILCDDKGVCQ